MTKDQQLAFIKEKCWEANPEIKELKRNCLYQRKAIKGRWFTHELNNDNSYENLCGCKKGVLTTQAFTSFKCGLCRKGKSWHNGMSPKWCIDCAKDRSVCPHCKTGLRILGRDIHLADVLLAIKDAEDRGKNYIEVEADGSMTCIVKFERTIVSKVCWNLLKTLDDQEEECLTFIYNLLK